jgi:hypothetical protein
MEYIIVVIIVLVIAAGLFGWGWLSQKRLYGPQGHKRHPDIYVLAMHARVKKHLKKGGFDSLTQAEKVCWSVLWLWRLVQIGGFENYYGESFADYAVEAADGFEAIGAKCFADIVRRANETFENGRPPRIRELRKQQVEQMNEEDREFLYQLDEEFKSCDDDFQVLLAEYIAEHRQEFLRA